MGKSALLRDALVIARARDAAVCSVRATELERDLAFGIVGQLLSPAIIGANEARLAELFSGAATLARPVLGLEEIEPRPTRPPRRSTACTWPCANLAGEGPLVLAVDDLH